MPVSVLRTTALPEEVIVTAVTLAVGAVESATVVATVTLLLEALERLPATSTA